MWCLRRDFRMHKTMVSCEGLCRAAGCTWCDAPATPAERRRKAKPKGKAAFNLHFKLFLGSRWEDGDLFCSLDPHFQNSRGCRSAEWPSRQEHPPCSVGVGYTAAKLPPFLCEPAQAGFQELCPWSRQKRSCQNHWLFWEGQVQSPKPHLVCEDVPGHTNARDALWPDLGRKRGGGLVLRGKFLGRFRVQRTFILQLKFSLLLQLS